jgi:hypothetical protein
LAIFCAGGARMLAPDIACGDQLPATPVTLMLMRCSSRVETPTDELPAQSWSRACGAPRKR